MVNDKFSLKTKLIVAINLAAILALLIFTAANANSCKSDLYLLWTINPSILCDGGKYHLYICTDENGGAEFVSTCTSGIEKKRIEEEFFFLPLIEKNDVILGIPPVPEN